MSATQPWGFPWLDFGVILFSLGCVAASSILIRRGSRPPESGDIGDGS